MSSIRIAVVDSSIADFRSLVESFGPDIEVLLIDGSKDGWSQLASQLSGRSDIGSLHIYSHGSAGSVQLGSTTLSVNNLAQHASVLAEIGSHLAADGDVLLYGCSAGAGDAGHQFINQFAAAVGADVAASDDLTGTAALGGDWVLEARAGEVQAEEIALPGYTASALANIAPVKSSNALNFDGVNDYVSVSGITGLPVGDQSYTIEAWIKAESAGIKGVIGWGNYTNDQVNAVRLDTDGGVINYWFFNDLKVSIPDVLNGWHHIAFTYDGTTRKAYVDGVLKGSDTPTDHKVPATSSLTIGRTFSSEYFDGGIDSVRVWNVARTQAEIQSDKDTQLSGSEAGLIVNYEFNQAGGTGLTDSAGVAENGVLNGFTLTGTQSNWVAGVNLYQGSGNEDTAYTLTSADLLKSWSDADGGTLSISGLTATNGSLVANPGGTSWTFTPNANFNGLVNLSYTVSDGQGANVAATGQLSIKAINDAPTFSLNPKQLIYETATPVFSSTSGPVYTQNNSGLSLSLDGSRVFYRMEATAADGTLYYAEVSFDAWSGLTPDQLAIPTLSNGLSIQRDVTNMTVTSNYPNVINGSGLAGRLEIWPYQYRVTSDTSVYDNSDVPNPTATPYGSFQVHNLTNSQTVFAWNDHTDGFAPGSGADIGFGNSSITQVIGGSTLTATDWTFAGSTAFPGAWKLQIGASWSNSGTLGFTEDTAGDIVLAGTPFADVEGDALTVTLAVSSGSVSGAAGSGVTVGGTATARTFTGTAANLNAYFSTAGHASYQPAANASGSAPLTLTVSDGQSSTQASLTLAIQAVNDAPTINSDGGAATAAVSVAENTTVVTTVASTDVDGVGLTYSIVGGADSTKFNIDASTGALTFKAAPTFEVPVDAGANNVYDVTVRVSDGAASDDQAIAVTVLDINEAPSAVTLTTVLNSIAENANVAGGVKVATIAVSDDALGSETLGLSGADAASFEIRNGNELWFKGASPNYEAQASYQVAVTADDASIGAAGSVEASSATFTLAVTNVNEAPALTGTPATLSAGVEDTAYILSKDSLLQGWTDVDGDTLSISQASADHGTVAVNADGSLTFTPAANFNGMVNLSYSVLDGQGSTVATSRSLEVAAVNDAPTANTGSVLTLDGTGDYVATNLTSAANFNKADFTIEAWIKTTGANEAILCKSDGDNVWEGGEKILYVNGNGQLYFEAHSNGYIYTGTAVNDGEWHHIAVTWDYSGSGTAGVGKVYIDGVDQTTSPAYFYNANYTTDSGSVGIGLSATAAYANFSGQMDSLRLWDVARSASEIVDGMQQPVAANSVGLIANYEFDSSSAGVVSSSTGGYTGTLVADASLVAATVSAVEQTALAIHGRGMSVADPDSGTAAVTVTLSVGQGVLNVAAGASGVLVADSGSATVTLTGSVTQINDLLSGGSGATAFYVNTSDAPSASTVLTLTVNDNGNTGGTALTAAATRTVLIQGVNDAPVIQSHGGEAAASVSVSENALSVSSVAATDAEGAALTYSIVGGADSTKFNIDANTGALTFKTAPNFEAPADAGANNVYDVTVRVSDGTASDDQAIAVTVTDVNDNAPVVTSGQSFAVAENAANGAEVGSVALTDADSAGVNPSNTFAITAGNDSGAFAINEATGQITVADGSKLNYEGSNSQTLTVQVSDGVNAAITQTVTLNLTDVNDAPSAITLTTVQGAITENADVTGGVKVATIGVSDDALGSETLGLTGADAALFEIRNGSELWFKGDSPDHETKSSYQVAVTADDASIGAADSVEATSQTFTLAVTDVNEHRPVITAGQTLAVAENAANGSVVGSVAIVDADSAAANASNTFSITGGNANGAFAIDAATGQITVADGGQLNFEGASSQALTVQVTDNTGSAGHAGFDIEVAYPTAGTVINSFEAADALLSGSNRASNIVTTAAFIDYGPVSGDGFSNNLAFPGVGGDDFALKATTQITIPADGVWTFGKLSDDGFRLKIDGEVVWEHVGGGHEFKQLDLSAGTHALEMVFYERGGGENVALFAQQGAHSSFNSGFKLIGDTANGGLAASTAAVNVSTQTVTVQLTDLNEAPSAVTLTTVQGSIAENANVTGGIQVATIGVSDDALGNETLGLTGADAQSFEIRNGSELWFKGVSPDFENQSSYQVAVKADDADIGAAGTVEATSATFTLAVTNTVDAPTVRTGSSLVFTEGQAATTVASSLTISGTDTATLTGATVQITGNYQAGADVLAFANQAGITGSWNPSNGSLTLTGSATVAAYEAALRSVTFANGSENPAAADRTVSIVVDGGAAVGLSAPAVHTIDMQPVDDAPTLALAGLGGSSTLIYQVNTPVFSGAAPVYAVNTASANAGLGFDRVHYRMEATTNAGVTYYADVSFDAWSGVTVAQLAVPTSANGLFVQRDVYNLTVDSNYAGVTTGAGYTGRLELWSGNYSGGPAAGFTGSSSYDYGDTGGMNVGYGSFQVHNLSGTPQTVFAWNNHNSGNPDIGFGNRPAGDPDWTFAGRGIFTGAWNLKIYAETNSGVVEDIGGNLKFKGTPFTDVDSGTLTVTLTVPEGTLNGAAGSGITVGGTSAERTFTGSVADLNAYFTTAGKITYTPVANANGNRTLTVSASDGSTTTTSTVDFLITPVNDAPTLSGVQTLMTAGAEDTAYTITQTKLLEGWSDVDGNTLSVQGLTSSNGTLTNNNNGTWTFTPTANFSGTVNLSYQVGDGQGASIAASRTIDFAAVNDAPVVNGSGTLVYTGRGAPVALASGLTLADVDSVNAVGATVKFTGNYQNGQDVLAFVNTGKITGVWDAASGTLTLSGTATTAEYQNALRSITYADAGTLANTGGVRTVSFQVDDGSTANNLSVASLRIVTDAPALTGTQTALPAGIEDTAYSIIQAQLLDGWTDVDKAVLSVQGLSASNGTVNASGTGQWTYTPNLNYNGPVTFSYQVIDGQGSAISATRSINLTAVNDPTVVSLSGVLIHTNNGAAAALMPAISLTDVDSSTLTSATVKVSANYLLGQDVLAFGGTAKISGNWDAASGTLTLTGSATLAEYEAALRAVTYVDSGEHAGARTISVQVNDGGAEYNLSSVVTRSVTDAPVRSGTPAAMPTGTEDTVYTLTRAQLLDGWTDADAGTLNPTNVTSTQGTVVNNGNGTWTYTPSLNVNGTVSLSYQVTDGQGASVAATRTFDLTPVNDAPTLGANTVSNQIQSDTSVGIPLNANTSYLRGLASDGQYLYVNDNGSQIDVYTVAGAYVGTHSVSGLRSDNSAITVAGPYLYARNGSTVTRISTQDWTTTAVSVQADKPLLSAKSWIVDDLFSLPDGRVATISADSGGTSTVRLYNVSPNGLTFTWSEDRILKTAGTPADNHGTASDGTYVYIVDASGQTYRSYSLATGDLATGPGVNLQSVSSGIAPSNATFFTHDHVNGVFYVGGHSNAAVLKSAAVASSNGTLTGGTEDTARSITYADLIAAMNEADVDGDTLSFRIEGVVSGALTKNGEPVVGGSTLVSAGDTLVWTPVANANGTIDAFTVRAWDGVLASSKVGTVQVVVAAVNDTPTLDATGTLTYTENQAGQILAPALTVGDVEGTLSSATVQITGNYQSGADLLAFTNQNGITGSWNSGTGTLTLSGAASVANYQAALRTVTYVNTSDNPSTADRTVSVQVNDGASSGNLSAVSTHTITVAAVNDVPVVVSGSDTSHDTGLRVTTGGAADIATVPHNAALNVESSYTIEMWVKLDTVTQETNLVEKGAWAGSWLMHTKPVSGGAVFSVASGNWRFGSTGSVYQLSSTKLQAGTLYHLAATWDGTTSKIYVNGVLEASEVPTGDPAANSSPLYIGSRPDGSYQANGLIADVRVWNTVHTQTEISAQMNATLTGQEAGLRGYWKLDEAAGSTTIVDSSSTHANGTVSGGAVLGATMTTGSSNVSTFTEGSPVAVASGTLISDPDADSDWVGGSAGLTVQITGNASTDDRLSLPTSNPGNGGVWVDTANGNALMVGSTAIGTASAASVAGGQALVFTFTSATDAQVQAVARAVNFTIESDAPSTAARTVTFTAADQNSSASATQTINVVAVNDAPLLTGTPVTLGGGTEDTPYTVLKDDLLQGWTDIDSAMLDVSGLSSAQGVVGSYNSTTRSWTFTPNANFNGAVTLSYSVTDGNGGSVATTRSFAVDAVNDAPVGNNDTLVGTSLPSYTYNAANGHYYKYVSASATIVEAYAAAKAAGGYLVTVTNAAENAFVKTLANGNQVWIDLTDTAVEGTWRYAGGPETGQQATYFNWGGSEPNNSGDEDYVSMLSNGQWNDWNTGGRANYVIENNGTSTDEDHAFTIQASTLLANDTDVEGHALSLTAVSGTSALGAAVTLNNGVITYDPAGLANFQALAGGASVQDSFTYTVSDGQGGSSTATVTFNVGGLNDAPVLTSTAATLATGTEDTTYTIKEADLLQGWSDVDNGTTLSITGLTSSQGSVGSFNSITRSWSFTPNSNYNGTATLSFSVSDGTAAVATTRSFDLQAINDAPTLNAGTPSATLVEAGGASNATTGIASATINLNKADVDGTTPSYDGAWLVSNGWSTSDAGSTYSRAGTYGVATLTASTSVVSYALDNSLAATQALKAGQAVADGFTVQVTDGTLTASKSFSFAINGSNDVAVLSDTTNPAPVVEAADANAQNLAAITGSFAVSDVDVGNTLTASVVGSPVVQLNGVTIGSGFPAALTAAGVFTLNPTIQTSNGGNATAIGWTYDPAAANLDFLKATDTLTVTYQVKVNDGSADSAVQDVTISIAGTNDAPTLTATGGDPTFTEGAAHAQGAAVAPFTAATANTIEAGQLFTGLSFTVGGLADGAAEVVYVDGTRIALLDGATGQTTQGAQYAVSLAGSTSTVSLTFPTALSAADVQAGVLGIRYQNENVDAPTPGDRVFTLTRITDNGGGTDTATLATSSTVHVVAVNDAPVLVQPLADQQAVGNVPFRFTLPADSLFDIDTPNAVYTATLTNGDALPTWLSFDSATRTFSGTAARLINEAYDIKATLSDGSFSASDVFHLTAIPGNALPTSASSHLNLTEDRPYAFTLADFTFADEDSADRLATVKLTSLPSAGALLLDGKAVLQGQVVAAQDINAGKLVFQAAPDANGLGYATLGFTVNDGYDDSAQSYTLTLDVARVNDAPVVTATLVSPTGAEDATLTITASQLLQGLGDVDGDSLSVVNVLTNRGTLTSAGADTWQLALGKDQNGLATLNYSVVDGNGGSVAVTRTVNFAMVNDAPVRTGSPASLSYGSAGGIVLSSEQLLTGWTDVDGDARTVAGLPASNVGSVVARSDGGWDLVLPADYQGELRLSYSVSDGTVTVPTTLNLLVAGANTRVATGTTTISATANGGSPNLVLTGNASANGTGDTRANYMAGNAGANKLASGGGDDTLSGGDGNDTLDGGVGADRMDGGTGNDTFYVDNSGDVVFEATGQGSDTLYASVDFVLGEGVDIERLYLTGAANKLTGNSGANALNGATNNDTLSGGAGNDTLTGGAGADVMIGGTGNDQYSIEQAGDTLVENANEGTDIAYSSVNYTLGAGVSIETLVLTASAVAATGNELGNTLLGNANGNLLDGRAGNDVLDGGLGADTMIGGLGDDTFYVDNVGDRIMESSAQGSDTVYASVNFTLGAGVEVESLNLSGSTATVLIGNEFDNRLTGSTRADNLSGGAGNDTLTGGTGVDTMSGGTGNDLYYVDNVADQVIELAGQGVDTVYTTVNYTLASASEVESLVLTGSATQAVGNVYANTLSGGSLNDRLDGQGGNDNLQGGAGNDTLIGGQGADTLMGGAGADWLQGGQGADWLYGGAGNDSFVFDTAVGAGEVDRVADWALGDRIVLDNSGYTSLVDGSLSGAAFHSGAGLTGVTASVLGAGIYYDTTTGALYYDGDGSAATPAQQFAIVTGAPALSAASFTVQ